MSGMWKLGSAIRGTGTVSAGATSGILSRSMKCMLRLKIQFITAGGAFRTPFGWMVGAKGYDIKNGRSPEYDVVALYQNPCKCWSLGLFYLNFPTGRSTISCSV